MLLECGCNVEDSRMTVLGGEFSLILLVSGNWSNIAKVEAGLPKLQQDLGLVLTSRKNEARQMTANLLPYMVEVVALDHPGIVFHLANFFSSRDINIEDMVTSSYAAPHTGSPMFSMRLVVDIPSDMAIATLREEFLDFCDELNLDAVIEPCKN